MASKKMNEEEIHDFLEEDQDDIDSDVAFDDSETMMTLLPLLTTMMVIIIIMTSIKTGKMFCKAIPNLTLLLTSMNPLVLSIPHPLCPIIFQLNPHQPLCNRNK
jgi:hypothetical protein